MRARSGLPAVALAALAVAGCGITPNAAVEKAPPPVVTLQVQTKRIWMIQNGNLLDIPADRKDTTVEGLLYSLFSFSDRPMSEDGITTDLRGFKLDRVQRSQHAVPRDEVTLPRTLTVTVYIAGNGPLSKLAKMQIVCTAQEDPALGDVKIVRLRDQGPATSEGKHDCDKLR